MPVTVFAPRTKTLSSFDPVLAGEQLAALRHLRTAFGTAAFCRMFIMILAKKSVVIRPTLHGARTFESRLIPFEFTRIQHDLNDTAGLNNITVKGRQIGSTTFHVLVRLFLAAILNPGTAGLLISQTKAYGAQHFRILQRALKNFARSPVWTQQMTGSGSVTQTADELQQHLMHTQYSARHEILFDFLDSKVLVDSAENPDAGTGLTLNNLVCTEVAYWPGSPETLLAQAKEAVPSDGTKDYESTPNGMGGYFFEEWQRASQPNAEFRKHFYPWWMHDEYRLKPVVSKATLSDEERVLVEKFKIELDQVAWRRGKMLSLRGRFYEKYPEDDTSCFLSSGDLFFDKDSLRWLKMHLQGKEPLESFQNGLLIIYRRRIKGRRYLIAADCAEGKLISTENPDFNSAVVMDIDTGEEVAAYRSRKPPEDFAEDLVELAKQYNFAVIAPERNGPGATVILTLNRHLQYGNIYMHKEWHRERKEVIPVAGFPTTPRTRPIAINKLATMVRDATELWHDETFVNEALTFVWTSSNKKDFGGKRVPQGGKGCHDDTVMARAIGAYVRLVLLGYLDPIEVPSEHYGDTGEEEEAA